MRGIAEYDHNQEEDMQIKFRLPHFSFDAQRDAKQMRLNWLMNCCCADVTANSGEMLRSLLSFFGKFGYILPDRHQTVTDS
jgi:hypothetical protein